MVQIISNKNSSSIMVMYFLVLTLCRFSSAISYFRMPYNSDKWPEIQRRLGELEYQINTGKSPSFEVKYAIKKFDPETTDYNYDALFKVEDDPAWKSKLKTLYPKMAKIALRLPELIPNPGVRTLRQGENGIVRLTQVQVLSLLANSFFCTFSDREDTFPRNKFCTLFEGGSESKTEKLKTILHYFDRMLERYPPNTRETGNLITYERRALQNYEVPNWANSNRRMTEVRVVPSGAIEDSEGFRHLQVDFANKYLGGGVLGNGATQEELRFIISPELIVSSLLFEALDDNEAAIITGIERFSSTDGYAGNVKYEGDYRDSTPFDREGRRDTSVVAIDALKFEEKTSYEQFRKGPVERELMKAYAGYSRNNRLEDSKPIATGNWGAGVFNGDAELKFILQWMAASEAGRPMKFFTWRRRGQEGDILSLLSHLAKANPAVTVGKMWEVQKLYKEKVVDKHQQDNLSLFKFIETDYDVQRLLGIRP